MALAGEGRYSALMQAKRPGKNRGKIRREGQPQLEIQAIPAPTILWHPSISLKKLISDFAEHRESIIVD